MLNKDTITIKLDKNTIKKLNHLKVLGVIDNMTAYSKKVLSEKINNVYTDLQNKIKKI